MIRTGKILPTFESTTSSGGINLLPYDGAVPRLWKQHSRAMITIADQAFVSIASFATNFILLHHLGGDRDHFAYFVLAINLLIWVAELHAALVFTPHTIQSPRRTGQALRRFHGSTLLHHFAISIVAMIALVTAGLVTYEYDRRMSHVLFMLAAGTIVIGLRNYARPYCFTDKNPRAALYLDAAVFVLQIGGILLLAWTGRLGAVTAIAMVGVASAIPSIVWLYVSRRSFAPTLTGAVADLREEWPHSKWVFLSGMVWNGGMQLYPWLIKFTCGNWEVAVWGACYQLAAVANPLLMGLQSFNGPRIAEAFTERDLLSFRRYVFSIAGWSTLLMILPSIMLCIFANAALAFLTKGEYHGHQLAITFLSAAIILQTTTFSLSRGLFSLQVARFDLYCNLPPLLLLFTGGAWLTLHFGATGAAASMMLAQVLASSSRAVVFIRATRPTVRSA